MNPKPWEIEMLSLFIINDLLILFVSQGPRETKFHLIKEFRNILVEGECQPLCKVS